MDDDGEKEALDFLLQWYHPGEHDTRENPPHGRGDSVFGHDGFIMSWNRSIPYVGLVRKLEE